MVERRQPRLLLIDRRSLRETEGTRRSAQASDDRLVDQLLGVVTHRLATIWLAGPMRNLPDVCEPSRARTGICTSCAPSSSPSARLYSSSASAMSSPVWNSPPAYTITCMRPFKGDVSTAAKILAGVGMTSDSSGSHRDGVLMSAH